MFSTHRPAEGYTLAAHKAFAISCNGPGLIEVRRRITNESLAVVGSFLNCSSTNMNCTVPRSPRGILDGEILHVILYSLVFFVAVLGNCLVIVTLLANKRMRTVTSCFLLSLSLSDLLLALICMPVSLTGRLLKRFVFGTVMCKVMPYFMGISVSVSTFTMLAISVERYYAICRPLKSIGWQTKSHAYKVIVGVWIFSFILNLPFVFLSQLHYIPLIEKHKCSLACRLNFPSPLARQIWYLFQLVSLFGIPGICMTVSYTMVSCKIWSEFKIKSNSESPITDDIDDDADAGDGLYLPRRKRRQFSRLRQSLRHFGRTSANTEEIRKFTSRTSSISMSSAACTSSAKLSTSKAESTPSTAKSSITTNPAASSGGKGRSSSTDDTRIHNATARLVAKKRVVKMLIIIVILFFACWTPLFIVNVWKAFDPQTAMEALDGAIEIIQLMSYISTCVNPIVYGFMNKRFREGFLNAFLCCTPKCCANIITKVPVIGTNGYH